MDELFSDVLNYPNFQVTEEREKLALVNTELNKLTQNLSKSAEMEMKVQDLEQKLQVAYSKSDEQASRKKHEISLVTLISCY